MMRFVIALGIAILIVVLTWPYLRHYMPRRPQTEAGAPKPPTKGELIYFAILVTVALSFTITTLMWVFGGR
jgi:hypothetical protein